MRRVSIALIVVGALLGAVSPPTMSEGFEREQLSSKGQRAYDRLLSACVFRVGGVGYSGQTSNEELALYELLDEQQAIDALRSLVMMGSYEGGLYGLLGLSIVNHSDFNRAVEVYKARTESRGRPANGGFECQISDGEMVTTQNGCLFGSEPRERVVTRMQSGHFDRLLKKEYRPSN